MPASRDIEPVLNRWLPVYDRGSIYERTVAADAVTCDRAFRELVRSDVRLLGPLLGLRRLPRRLLRRQEGAGQVHASRPLMEDFLDEGFTVLLDEPAEQVVAGAIGRWWSLTGNAPLDLDGAEAFQAFDAPGYAKAALSFQFIPSESGTLVRTETRIACTDSSARRRFGAYWLLIRLPSGLIRRGWLAAIERRALAIAG